MDAAINLQNMKKLDDPLERAGLANVSQVSHEGFQSCAGPINRLPMV
jgi:hypothetical protein